MYDSQHTILYPNIHLEVSLKYITKRISLFDILKLFKLIH